MRLFTRRPREVVLLGRAGCHLCEEMEKQVRAALAAGGRRGDALAVMDVDADPDLRQQYSEAVPVLLVNGSEIARWRVDDATLRAALGLR